MCAVCWWRMKRWAALLPFQKEPQARGPADQHSAQSVVTSIQTISAQCHRNWEQPQEKQGKGYSPCDIREKTSVLVVSVMVNTVQIVIQNKRLNHTHTHNNKPVMFSSWELHVTCPFLKRDTHQLSLSSLAGQKKISNSCHEEFYTDNAAFN